MQRPSSITQTGKQPGLLDHLSEGMSLLLTVPQLMVVPILVDLYLLLGPRLSSVSVTDRLAGWSGKQEGGSAANVADWLSKVGDWDLSRLMALLIPSVVDGLPRADVFEPYDRGYFESSIVVAIVLGAIFILIGTALFVGFLVMLGQSGQMIRGEAQSLGRLILDRWLKFLAFAAIVVAIASAGALALIVPTVLISASDVFGSAIVGFLSLGFFGLLVVTMFVPEAIVIDGAGPLTAIRSSARVVFGSFWSAIGFFAISLMFSPGLLSIWEEIAGDPVGLTIAIVVNAALITSLAMANLSFYRSRTDELAPAIRAV